MKNIISIERNFARLRLLCRLLLIYAFEELGDERPALSVNKPSHILIVVNRNIFAFFQLHFDSILLKIFLYGSGLILNARSFVNLVNLTLATLILFFRRLIMEQHKVFFPRLYSLLFKQFLLLYGFFSLFLRDAKLFELSNHQTNALLLAALIIRATRMEKLGGIQK